MLSLSQVRPTSCLTQPCSHRLQSTRFFWFYFSKHSQCTVLFRWVLEISTPPNASSESDRAASQSSYDWIHDLFEKCNDGYLRWQLSSESTSSHSSGRQPELKFFSTSEVLQTLPDDHGAERSIVPVKPRKVKGNKYAIIPLVQCQAIAFKYQLKKERASEAVTLFRFDDDAKKSLLDPLVEACGDVELWYQDSRFYFEGTTFLECSREQLQQAWVSLFSMNGKQAQPDTTRLALGASIMFKSCESTVDPAGTWNCMLQLCKDLQHYYLKKVHYSLSDVCNLLVRILSDASHLLQGAEFFLNELELFVVQKRKSIFSLKQCVEKLLPVLKNSRFEGDLESQIICMEKDQGYVASLRGIFCQFEEHFVCGLDHYSIPERIIACGPAIEIVKQIMCSPIMGPILKKIQTIIWKLLTKDAVSLIWFVVFESHSNFLTIWISNKIQWSFKFRDLNMFQILDGNELKDRNRTSKPCLNLPLVNTDEFRSLMEVQINLSERRKFSHQRYIRHLKQLQCLWDLFLPSVGKSCGKEYKTMGGFTYVSECHLSFNRIQCDVISPNPVSGLCLSKTIDVHKAAMLFNHDGEKNQDNVFSLETSRQLYPAEVLSRLGAQSEIDVCNFDQFQASFDAFSSLPNSVSKTGNMRNKCNKTFLSHHKSPRNMLLNVQTVRSLDLLAESFVRSLEGSFSPSERSCVKGSTGHLLSVCNSKPQIDLEGEYQADLDEDSNPANVNTELMDSVHHHWMKTGNNKENEKMMDEQHHEAETVTINGKGLKDSKYHLSSVLTDSLNKLKHARYVQADISGSASSSPAGTPQTVQGVSFMLIMPDVAYIKDQFAIVNQPVSTTFLEQRCVDGADSSEVSVWCNCTCNLFRLGCISCGKYEQFSKTFWFFQRLTKVYDETQIRGCPHTGVKTEWIRETFLNSIQIWSTEASILKVILPSCKDLEASHCSLSIAFTSNQGRDPVGNEEYHNVAILPISFSSNSKIDIFSIDAPSAELRHAFISRSIPKHPNLKICGEYQITCLTCGSKSLALGSNRHCAHLNAWNAAAMFTSVLSHHQETRAHGVSYKSEGLNSKKITAHFNPDVCCNVNRKATGYIFPSYTRARIPFDFEWNKSTRKLIFGQQIRILSDKQAKILNGCFPTSDPDGCGSYFELDCGRFLEHSPANCPLCLQESPEETSPTYKMCPVTLYTADKAIVRTKLKYWHCTHCNIDVRNNGVNDGFWFHSKTTAVSMKTIYDLLTLQAQGMEDDFSSFVAHCEQQTQARMGDKFCRYLGAHAFSEVFFAMLASCDIGFNQPCFGCWLSFKDFPVTCQAEDIINCKEPAPPAARDISHVGMDGVANFMSRRPTAKQSGESPKSSCKQKPTSNENKQHPLLQHDRCPVKTVTMVESTNAIPDQKKNAARVKELFKKIGNSYKDISRSDVRAWKKKTRDVATSVNELIGMCNVHEDGGNLSRMKSLLYICLDTENVLSHFKQQKASRFLYNAGDLFGQIGSAASILTLLKPNLVPACFDFCRAFERGAQAPDASGMSSIGALHAALICKCKPGSSEFPAAFTIFVLLDFFQETVGDGFQNNVNMTIASTIRFIATRCTEVVENCGIRAGTYPIDDEDESCWDTYPVPIRVYGRDIDKRWPDKLLGINPPNDATCDPVANNGFYSFTVHGKPVRSKGSADNTTGPLFCGDSECKKPSWRNQAFTARSNFKQMLFTTFCIVHSIFMGYHIIEGGEGRKDPHNAIVLFKETCPQSISYDFACG